MNKSVRMIVLKRMKWAEADLIIHGLEPSGARLHCLARGALKSKRRFGGGLLEPTHFLECQIKTSTREEGLHALEDARLLEGFEGLRQDYDRLNLALRFLDIIDRSNPGDFFPEIFNLLGNSLKSLAAGAELARVEVQFGLKFLKLHGVLEFDEWMAPFLERPIATPDGESSFPAVPVAKRNWLSEQIKRYVHSAAL